MKKFAWSLGFVALGVASAAASGCTVTITSDDGGDLFDSGTGPEFDTSTPVADTGPVIDTATPTVDTGSGPTCAILMTDVSFGTTCDACIGSNCCNETTACFAGAENPCADLVSCFADCLVGNPDAGIAAGDNASCKSDCEGGSAMPVFDAWVTCVTTTCVTTCQ
jgi:hypothetical protein